MDRGHHTGFPRSGPKKRANLWVLKRCGPATLRKSDASEGSGSCWSGHPSRRGRVRLRQQPEDNAAARLQNRRSPPQAEAACRRPGNRVGQGLPANKTRIDDLDAEVVDLLRQLPGIVHVEIAVAAAKPKYRIVHLRDYHFVTKDLYALDMKQAHGRELTDDESDQLHQELLLEVELVQIEQMALLRCLIKHHGLKRIFSEGFSPGELEAYREKIVVLRSMDKEQVPQVRKQLEDVRKVVEGATGEKKAKAEAIESDLVTMLDEHKHRLLEIGMTCSLMGLPRCEWANPAKVVSVS